MNEYPTEFPRPCGVILAFFLAVLLGACRPALAPEPVDPLQVLRGAAEASPNDGDAVGRLLLGELLVPGGVPAKAVEARRKLDAIDHRGMFGSLARAIDDEAHGRFRSAAMAHMDVLEAARKSSHSLAPLAGWFSARHLLSLRSSVAGLWEKARAVVEQSIAHPGNLGWRARSELVEWWGVDGFRAGGREGTSRAEALAQRYGCVQHARLAGPFGNLAPSDHRRHFEAEHPGPWPFVFPPSKRQKEPPFVIPNEIRGCTISPADSVMRGVYYVETFVDLPAEREAIVAVQGSYAVFVDDVEVLTRDAKQWGIWPRFGVRVRLGAGRHRIVARIMQSETAIRLLAPDGTPLEVKSSDDPAPPYTLNPPGRLPDPNVLHPFLTALGVPPQPGAPRSASSGLSGGGSEPSIEHPNGGIDVDHPIARYLAAYLTHLDGQNDVSSVLIEPLVSEPSRATGPALAMQAVFVEKDPIFPENDARDLVKDIRARAAAKDPELWWPRFWLALDEADKAGVPEVASKIAALADHFREVPDILSGLITIYSRMGWKVEHSRTVKQAAARFPDDIDAQYALLRLLDAQGDIVEADQVAARIRKLDPETELDFERAIERQDYAGAIRELERIAQRRKDRKDIATRISGLLTRAGTSSESLESLERALAKDPSHAPSRLALADARTARGDQGALRRALVDAIQTGSDTASIRDAMELVEGTTELTPFRQDGRKIVAEFEAKKPELPGTAARVLDYAALWVHADGSARMLEHQIMRIQSREGIQEHAEQRVPDGLVLKLRTIKKDGRILEPEFVDGKPTVTMPHLEVDDYIETESLVSLRGDGRGGRMFQGPRWFFREEKIPYWRSEFVIISPKNRPLDIETGGSVPDPMVTESGALVTRRWRVDQSPALPEEPASAPLSEFLPNVRIGWGVNLKDAIDRAVDANTDETPRDPRLYRMALAIANAQPPGSGILSARQKAPAVLKGSIDERARRIYRWVVANVEAGKESDGRQVVVGKSGNRVEAFLYLCRLIGIDASIAAVRDRLTPPSRGPLSEAESFNSGAIRIVTERGPRWMIVQNKYAPYGYLPSALRGQPAVILKPGAPREITPTAGSRDAITYRGVVDLALDGSAKLSLEQSFEGRFAIRLRSLLETVPDARLEEVIESLLLAPVLPGARLRAVKVKDLADLDAPLTLAMELEMGNFARVRGSEIVLAPPFALQLAGLASLSSRETPLYISEDAARSAEVKLSIRLPAGAEVATPLAAAGAENGDRIVAVRDRVERNTLLFERFVDLPAGRVKPADYAAFQTFVRRADAALNREVVISLSKVLQRDGRPAPPSPSPQGAPK